MYSRPRMTGLECRKMKGLRPSFNSAVTLKLQLLTSHSVEPVSKTVVDQTVVPEAVEAAPLPGA